MNKGSSVFNVQSATTRSGLNILQNVSSVHIEQTYELHQDTHEINSENRFCIRDNTNKTIFGATETSTSFNRLLWGSSRPFTMNIVDTLNEKILIFDRKYLYNFPLCCQQYLDIRLATGEYFGRIQEKYSFSNTQLHVENNNFDVDFVITAPSKYCPSYKRQELQLEILKPNAPQEQAGTITRMWNPVLSTYTMNVKFPVDNLTVHSKVLLIGAAMLLEYIFFQSTCCC